MRLFLATAVAAALTLVTAPLAAANKSGPDWVSSDNVEYLGSIKQDVGLTTGAKVVGDRLYVTSGKNITIYDISKPESPQTLGSMKVNTAWENEEVPAILGDHRQRRRCCRRIAGASEGALHRGVRRVRALGALAAQGTRQVRADRRRDQLHRPLQRRQRRVPHVQRRGGQRQDIEDL